MSNNYIQYEVTVIEIKHYKTLSVEEYLNKIRPYLKGIINNLKKSDTGKLTTAVNFISSKDDNDKGHIMHSKGYNIEIMINDETDEVIKELCNQNFNIK